MHSQPEQVYDRSSVGGAFVVAHGVHRRGDGVGTAETTEVTAATSAETARS